MGITRGLDDHLIHCPVILRLDSMPPSLMEHFISKSIWNISKKTFQFGFNSSHTGIYIRLEAGQNPFILLLNDWDARKGSALSLFFKSQATYLDIAGEARQFWGQFLLLH